MRIDLFDFILVYELEIETEGVHRKTFWNTIIETKYGVFDMPCPQPKVDDITLKQEHGIQQIIRF